MSEPTPLSAAELAAVRNWKPLTTDEFAEAVRWWLSMSSYRKGKHSRYLATIDAQATEIAALKGALTERDALLKALEPTIAYAMAHSWTEPDFAELERLRVLAGKEAQCPKCEGRGFIRTMVDGERDSEPCSFCRMSGLAGKEAQGD